MKLRVEFPPVKPEREYIEIPAQDIKDLLIRVITGELTAIVIEADQAAEILKRFKDAP